MNSTSFTTGEVRMSFVHLTKPYTNNPGQQAPKYSVTCLLPKTDTATKQAIDAAISAATQLGINSKWNGSAPAVVNTPIHDGDGVRPNGEPFGPECKGCWVFTASTQEDHKPELVDTNLQAIIQPSEIYSGMYGRVNVNVFPYFNSGRKGLGFGLGPVQKTRDGEALGGTAVSARDAFGAPAGAPKVNPITGLPE